MNFEIFDDDFEQDKKAYLEEIYSMSDSLISTTHRGEWNLFVSNTMKNTRSYYIISTALKVMQNLNDGLGFDSCVFNSLAFLPDQTFVETMVLVVAKYHPKGIDLANHFHFDTSKITLPKEQIESADENPKIDKKNANSAK